jgi:Ca-activated chloride channel family protein
MNRAHFADPAWLLLLAVLPLLAWRHHRALRAAALPYSRLPTIVRRNFVTAVRLHGSTYARLGAAALLVLALARPQLGYAWEETSTEGIDIEIALDVSGSMGADDFGPRNRLEVAKEVLQDFIAGRPADRMGLVAFAGAAMTRAPLTTDREMLRFLVDALELHELPEGTAIGMGLASAAARLRGGDATTRVIVLVTDGANNSGEIDPRAAMSLCQTLGIRVYTIGVGRDGVARVPTPVRDALTGRVRVETVSMRVEVDETLLREIATTTGGRFFRALDGQGLSDTFHAIDALEKTPRKVKQYVRYREAFMPFAWAGLVLAALPVLTGLLGWSYQP